MFNKNIFKILTMLIFFHPTVYAKTFKPVAPTTKMVHATKIVHVKKSAPIKQKVSKAYIEEAIVQAAQKAGVPVDLLRGICTIESNLIVDSFAHDDGGSGIHSYGICQISSLTAAKYLGKDKNCQQDFRGLEKSYKTCKYFGPKLNALAAARYLKTQLDRYDGHPFKAAAAYNSGSLRKCSSKGWVTNKKGERLQRCKPGDLLNRYYITRLTSVLSKTNLESSIELADANFKLTADKKS